MRRITIFVVIALIAYSVSSCILEDRSNCPAYLDLEFQNIPEDMDEIYLFLKYNDKYIVKDTVRRESFGNFEIPIRRGGVVLSAFGNIDEMVYEDGYIVRYGSQADSVYTAFRKIYCNSDVHKDIVDLKKDYINLHLRVICCEDESDSLSVVIRSSVIGYDLQGNMKNGSYCFSPSANVRPNSGSNYYEFTSRVINQSEKDLDVDVYMSEGGGDKYLLRSINVADILYKEDIEAGDVDDIFVIIDLSKSEAAVSVRDWEDMNFVEVEM